MSTGARNAFVEACVNATHHGFSGCFIDSAAPPSAASLPGLAARCNSSVAAMRPVGQGLVEVMAELQSAVGDSKLIVA